MARVLKNIYRSRQNAPVFGVIELSEGEGYYIAEFDSLPSLPHLPYTYEFFDDTDDISSLEEKFQVKLNSYQLVHYSHQNSDI